MKINPTLESVTAQLAELDQLLSRCACALGIPINQPPAERSAVDEYMATHSKCLAELDRIRQDMFDLPAAGGDVLINWAHVGDVGRVLEQLREVEP